MNENTEITITLTVGEINFIADTLAELPFKKVNTLLNKVITQGNKQLLSTEKETSEMKIAR